MNKFRKVNIILIVILIISIAIIIDIERNNNKKDIDTSTINKPVIITNNRSHSISLKATKWMSKIVLNETMQVKSIPAKPIHFHTYTVKIDKNGDRLSFLWPTEWKLIYINELQQHATKSSSNPPYPAKSLQSVQELKGSLIENIPPNKLGLSAIYFLAIGDSYDKISFNKFNNVYKSLSNNKKHYLQKTRKQQSKNNFFANLIGGKYAYGKYRLWGRWSLILSVYNPSSMAMQIGTKKSIHVRVESSSVGLMKMNSIEIFLWSPDKSANYELTYRIDWLGPPNDKVPRHRIMPAFKVLEKRLISGFRLIEYH